MAQYENGGWYNGRQYWNGQFGAPGQIINPNQVGSTPIGGSSNNNGGNSGGGSAEDILNNAINAITRMVPPPPKPYEQVNPFSFDEALARQASTAEYAPYYKQLLTDYTSNIERTKSRSQQDLTKTLDQLNAGKEYYTGTQRMLLDKALKSTNEGYAGNGLFMSGARTKDLQDLQKQNEADVGHYLSGYNYNVDQAKTANNRTVENADTAASQYTRDTTREQQAAIEGGILQRKSEAQAQYEAGRQKYYQNAMYGGVYG